MIISIGEIDIIRSVKSDIITRTKFSARRHYPISIVAIKSCPSNGSDYASTHCHFSDKMIFLVDEVDITQCIKSNSVRIVKLSTCRHDSISIVASKSCARNRSDDASACSNFSDTMIFLTDEVDIALSINRNTIRLTYLSNRRRDSVSIVAIRSCPSNCYDEFIQSVCESSTRLIVQNLPVGVQ